VGDVQVSFTKRKKYTVKSVIADLKKINPTPKVTYDIGNRLVYYAWDSCVKYYGHDHPMTKNFHEFLKFMQEDYESQLVQGEFWRASDTPSAALNIFLKDRPKDFLDFQFSRTPEYIFNMLKEIKKMRAAEIKKFKKIEKKLKKLVKDEPENADYWNQYRLVLWIVEKYKESSKAFQTAKKLGWTNDQTSVVAL
jgi:tetratricopeptide (TPR) repeat protein